MSLYGRILEGSGPRKWDITHRDLPDGSMKLVQHSTGVTKILPREQADQLRSDINEIERRWKSGVPQHTAYPNVHLHIDALLLPRLSEGVCDNREADKPWRTPGERKKFAVCVNDGGDKKVVRFGDPNMEIKRDDPARRKNFRARHNCDSPGPKTKARYWSCQGTWHPKKSVSDVVEGSLYDRIVQEERPERSGAVKVSLVKHKDQMPGGKGDKLKPEDVDPEQLRMGIEVEMEHTKDRALAQEIALDHLAEDPKYYTKLKKVHQEGKACPNCGSCTCGRAQPVEEDESLIVIEADAIFELRDSCLDCVRKHLSQALVLMQEALQGYPEHRWAAIGHLGEASDEAIKEYPNLAHEIREHRLKYMDDPGYSVPCLQLIAKASALIEANDFPSKFPSTVSPSNRTGVGTAPPEDEEPDALKIVQDGPDDDEEPDIPIKIVAQTEDVLLERKPTKKELASGKRPDDVTWKEWLAAGGKYGGGSSSKPKSKSKSKSKSKKSKDKKPKDKPDRKPQWWDEITKGMDMFDDEPEIVGGSGYSSSGKSGSYYKPKPRPKRSPEEQKLHDMAKKIGSIDRIAAGGIVFKTFEGPDFWDLPVLVSKVHPKWGNYWVFPKGGLDLGEHIYKGAAREVEEESGVKAKVVNPLAFKHTSKLSERGKYDLPLVLSVLKKKFPSEAKFIEDNAEKLKTESFRFNNKSHYFIMKHTGGRPRQSPGKDEEMAKSDWFPLRKAITMGDRQRRVVKFLLPVLYRMWKPTGGAVKEKSIKMPHRPRPPKSSSSSGSYKPGKSKGGGFKGYGKKGKGGSTPWGNLSLF